MGQIASVDLSGDCVNSIAHFSGTLSGDCLLSTNRLLMLTQSLGALPPEVNPENKMRPTHYHCIEFEAILR